MFKCKISCSNFVASGWETRLFKHKAAALEDFQTLLSHQGPHVSHHTLLCVYVLPSHAHTLTHSLSIRVIVLIWQLQPDTRRFHTWLLHVAVLLQRALKKKKNNTGSLSPVVFLLSPFKSTLRRSSLAPNAPAPFSKAKLWNPRSQAWSKTISHSDWANIHFQFRGETGVWYVLQYSFSSE